MHDARHDAAAIVAGINSVFTYDGRPLGIVRGGWPKRCRPVNNYGTLGTQLSRVFFISHLKGSDMSYELIQTKIENTQPATLTDKNFKFLKETVWQIMRKIDDEITILIPTKTHLDSRSLARFRVGWLGLQSTEPQHRLHEVGEHS